MDNTFTTEMVRGLFGPNIAPIISTYKCSYQRVSGRLYIASNALCFYSNLFGFERKLLIRIVDITFAGLTRTTSIVIRSKCLRTTKTISGVTTTTASVAAASIVGTNETGEDENSNSASEEEEQQFQEPMLSSNEDIIAEEHIFKSFDERESVLQVIIGLMGKKNEDLEKNDEANANTAINNSMTLTERLFDYREPLPSSQTTSLLLNQQHHQSHEQLQPMRLRTYSDPRDVHRSHHPNIPTSTSNHNLVPLRSRISSTPNWMKNKEPNRRVKKTTFKVSQSSSERKLQKTLIPTFEEMKINFASIDNYPECIIQSYAIPNLTMDEFYNHFLSDDAQWSFQVFQRRIIKDDNIQVTPWKDMNQKDNDCKGKGSSKHSPSTTTMQQSRLMSFIHPRSAKLGPSTAQTRKEQICTLYKKPSQGIVLYSKTSLEEVPYSDCFVVEEKWIIEPFPKSKRTTKHNTNSVTPGCQLSIKFKVNFIKSTLMKKVIYNQTKQEIKDWFDMYIKFLQGCVGNESLSPTLSMNSVDKHKVSLTSKLQILYAAFVRIWIILFTVGVCYYIYTLHLRILMLEEQVKTLIGKLRNEDIYEKTL